MPDGALLVSLCRALGVKHWLRHPLFPFFMCASFIPLSMPQGVRLPPLSDDVGCVGDKSWAGVYVDSISKEVLHLARGGRAFFSPGTAAGNRRGNMWWKVTEDRLRVLDSYDHPVNWPGTASDLRGDPVQAGKLAGFGVETDDTNSGPRRVENVHLVRDPLGFVFPGCSYVLSLRSQSPLMANSGHECRVVLNEDGTITGAVDGGRIARWSFPTAKPLVGDDEWATGDELLLVLESNCHNVRTSVVYALRMPEHDFNRERIFGVLHPKFRCSSTRATHSLRPGSLCCP